MRRSAETGGEMKPGSRLRGSLFWEKKQKKKKKQNQKPPGGTSALKEKEEGGTIWGGSPAKPQIKGGKEGLVLP